MPSIELQAVLTIAEVAGGWVVETIERKGPFSQVDPENQSEWESVRRACGSKAEVMRIVERVMNEPCETVPDAPPKHGGPVPASR